MARTLLFSPRPVETRRIRCRALRRGGWALLALGTILPAAADSSSPQADSALLTVSATGYACAPLGVQASRWQWFPLAGLEVTLPTGLDGLGVGLGAQMGQIRGAQPDGPQLLALEFGLTVSYRVRLGGSRFMVLPAIGLVSTAIFKSEAPEVSGAVFSWSESEFGPMGGVETAVRIRRWRVGVPVRFVCVLCAPDPFPHVDIGLKVSREF